MTIGLSPPILENNYCSRTVHCERWKWLICVSIGIHLMRWALYGIDACLEVQIKTNSKYWDSDHDDVTASLSVFHG